MTNDVPESREELLTTSVYSQCCGTYPTFQLRPRSHRNAAQNKKKEKEGT